MPDTAALPAAHLGFGRLVALELRKFVDTRSARWVLLSMALLSLVLAVVAARITGPAGPVPVAGVLAAAQTPLSLAAAIIGILGMTGDWAHRATTTYFPLTRSRGAVYAAKIAAAVLMTLAVFLVLLGAAALTATLFGAATGRGVSSAGLATAMSLSTGSALLGTLFGLGIASLVRTAALSLFLVFALGVGVNVMVLAVLPSGIQPAFSTLTPLLLFGPVPEGEGPTSALGWQIACSLLTWYVAPLVLGWRVAERAEA